MEEIQKQIANIVSELMPQLCALSDEIFDYAEPGYEEYRSSAALTKWLRAHPTPGWIRLFVPCTATREGGLPEGAQ